MSTLQESGEEMSVRIFSPEMVIALNDNKYVSHATDKRITYTDEFKQLFIERYRMGVTPRKIFKDAGFDVDALGYKRIEKASDRWRRSNNEGKFGTDSDPVQVHEPSTRFGGALEEFSRLQLEMIERLQRENAELRLKLVQLGAE